MDTETITNQMLEAFRDHVRVSPRSVDGGWASVVYFGEPYTVPYTGRWSAVGLSVYVYQTRAQARCACISDQIGRNGRVR